MRIAPRDAKIILTVVSGISNENVFALDFVSMKSYIDKIERIKASERSVRRC